MKVSFVVAGTQKGGTQALDYYLRKHPELVMPKTKEVHFFDRENVFTLQQVNYTIYHSFFQPTRKNVLLGESTPIYMYWYPVPFRIWQYNPYMKFIVLLRSPIERAFSHWNMEISRGYDDLSFGEAIRYEKSRCRSALPYQHRIYSYVDRGFYTEQLRRIWHFFPYEQTLILKSEDLKNDLLNTLNTACEFLGIRKFYPEEIEQKNIHSREYQASLIDRDREYLTFVYEFEIRQLERILGWDCSDWLP